MRALAQFTYFHAGRIVAASLLAVIVAGIYAPGVFEDTRPFDISDPDSEVERAYSSYENATARHPDAEVMLLVSTPEGPNDLSGKAAIEAVVSELKSIPGVASVADPTERRELIGDSRQQVLVLGILEAGEERVEAGSRVAEAFAADPEVTPGGTAVAAYEIGEQSERDTRQIEVYAAPFLLLMCLAVFRTVVAALLPLVVAAFSIILSLAALRLLTIWVDIDLFSLQVVTGLGVGLAVDYSLFMVARYRSERARGVTYLATQRVMLATSGRTVVFSSLTVAAALAALVLFPSQFLQSTGIAGALVALLSGAAALFVLPAVLALLGPRIEDGPVPGARNSLGRAESPPRFWRWLPEAVLKRPVLVATLALTAMLVIASPALESELTIPDARVLPEEQSGRQVADAIATDFSSLPPTRLQALIPAGSDVGRSEALGAVAGLPGVTKVSRPHELPDGSTEVLVFATLDPLSGDAQALVESTRALPWPSGTLIGGRAAELVDQRASISDTAPFVVALVVLTNLILVVSMLRSAVLPFLAVLFNLLTVAASYGVMVATFKSETLTDLLGTVPQQGVDISVPILAFAVVFGLSTDYGIFLFARIAEARTRGLGDSDAIVAGIARTGRLITASALIFGVAVGAFAFSDLVIVKESAIAIAVAVLLDAAIVRSFLLPAAMKLLGSRAWWWPASSKRRAGASLPASDP